MESKEKIDHFLNNLLSEKEKLLYQKAVNGNPESQVCMCVLAENATLWKYAEYWARKASEQGYSPAYRELGIMLNDYLGRSDEAVGWYIKAADSGDDNGLVDLFYEFRDSCISKENQLKVIKYLLQRANNGNASAKKLLIYLKESEGEFFGLSAEQIKLSSDVCTIAL